MTRYQGWKKFVELWMQDGKEEGEAAWQASKMYCKDLSWPVLY